MILDFDRGTSNERPIPVRMAVDRGHALVNGPVVVIMALVFGLGVVGAVVTGRVALALLGILGAPLIAWVWWSFAVPRWRDWAIGRGADPDELQRVAEAEKLVWPPGHLFERTEFRRRGR